jgi:hypothetical protein
MTMATDKRLSTTELLNGALTQNTTLPSISQAMELSKGKESIWFHMPCVSSQYVGLFCHLCTATYIYIYIYIYMYTHVSSQYVGLFCHLCTATYIYCNIFGVSPDTRRQLSLNNENKAFTRRVTMEADVTMDLVSVTRM